MPIIRFLDAKGEIRTGLELEGGRAEIARGDPAGGYFGTGEVADVARLLAPIIPTNIFGIGLNYRRHAAETGQEIPERPIVFMKPTSALLDPGAPIRIPACCEHGPEVDWEAELAVVIGRPGRDIPESRALEHVLGYTCANDVSARRWQKHAGGGQMVRGKSFDTFCPLGPRLLTPIEIGDPGGLAIRSFVNGGPKQSSTTADMVHGVAALIAWLSRDTTLLPGTVILTGTPEGVGVAREPPEFLGPGDEVVVEVEGIGRLVNPVVGPDGGSGSPG
ncbi:MAG TPA: fumarylacetoacetate hydrolase family protein [Polyangia bacterium]|nr:fumarylacetoacetate hydrolase family protein [Polyangia bacterium]